MGIYPTFWSIYVFLIIDSKNSCIPGPSKFPCYVWSVPAMSKITHGDPTREPPERWSKHRTFRQHAIQIIHLCSLWTFIKTFVPRDYALDITTAMCPTFFEVLTTESSHSVSITVFLKEREVGSQVLSPQGRKELREEQTTGQFLWTHQQVFCCFR